MRKALAAALAAAFSIVSTAQQSPSGSNPSQPVFRSRVNAVLLDVRVADRAGHFVDDLTPDDFQVSEDGVAQTLSTFEFVHIPMSAPHPAFAGTLVAPDVSSNEISNGRLYVLVLDDLNMHPLRGQTARDLARDFVEHKMQDDDRVSVVTTSGRKDLVVEFTDDRRRLLTAIDKFQAGYGIDRREPLSNSAHNALMALSGVAKWLSPITTRRKAIIFISEGFDGAMPDSWAEWTPGDQSADYLSRNDDPGGRASGDATDFAEIAETAARNNVIVYGIDPVGQPGAPAGTVKPRPWLTDDDVTSKAGYDRVTANRSALAALAEATGGFAAVRTNGFDQAFDRVVDESSSYYLLGYVSTNPAQDGRFRRIRVRSTRPGLTIRTRSGYRADTGKAAKPSAVPRGWTQELVDVLQSPVQVTGLTMSVAAAAFRDAKNEDVEVVVETRRDALSFTADGARSQDSVELAIVVTDHDGRVKASHHGGLDMNLQPGTRAAVNQYGVRLLTRLVLKPGSYEMRVAGSDAAGASAGSVHFALDVPDFSKGAVAMSGLLLASEAEARRPTSGSDNDWKARFPAPPTAVREFARDDELTVVGEVYNNASKTAPIDAVTTIANEANREVFRQARTLTGSAVYSEQEAIPLVDLAPGNYLLTMEARSRTNAKASASRQVLFTIR